MKTYIIIASLILFGLNTEAQYTSNYSYNAWENYYGQYGEYFDNYFGLRVYFAPTNRIAHERTLRELARLGIPYYNRYTGEYNHVQTATHIFNTSKTVEEYRARMEIWIRYGNVVYKDK